MFLQELIVVKLLETGEYFALFPEPGTNVLYGSAEKVFSITKDLDSLSLEEFQEQARQEARSRGIQHVINLDK